MRSLSQREKREVCVLGWGVGGRVGQESTVPIQVSERSERAKQSKNVVFHWYPFTWRWKQDKRQISFG